MRRCRPLALALPLLLAVSAPSVAQEDEKSWLVSWVEKTISTPDFKISLDKLDGALSSDVRIGAITIADRRGVWLRINNARLVWTRSDLLSGKLTVERLEAASIDVTRAPEPATQPAKPPAPAASEPFTWPQLPVTVALGTLQVPLLRLAAELAGEDMVLTVNGGGTFDAKGFKAKADVRRIADPAKPAAAVPTAAFHFDAGYGAENGQLALDLDYREPKGGLLARMMQLPDQPALALTVKGAGPLAGFAADLALQADGRQLVGGRATIARKPDHYAITADVNGTLESLARGSGLDFLKGGSTISLAATTRDAGGYTLDRFALKSGVMRLNLGGVFAADGFPTHLSLDGALTPAAGQPLTLPGATTSIAGARFKMDFGDGDWRADIGLDRLRDGGVSVAKVAFTAGGRAHDLSDPLKRATSFAVDGRVDGITGNDLDAALKGGVGARLRGDWQAGQPIRIAEAVLTPGGAKAQFAGTIDGATADGQWMLETGNLAAFRALTGVALEGRGQVAAKGRVSPATGAFDIALTGAAESLAVVAGGGTQRLPGKTSLSGHVTRDTGGLRINDLKLDGRKLQATVNGAMTPTTADLKATIRLDDLAAFTDPKLGVRGAVVADVAVSGALDAPTARYTVRGSRLSAAALRDAGLTAPWTLTAEGSATPKAVAIKAQMADGTGTRVAADGTVPLDGGRLALKVDANTSLALANAVLRERGAKVDGNLALAANLGGTLDRPEIRGLVSLTDGSFSDPETGMRLSALAGSVRLDGNRAVVERFQAVTGREGSFNLTGAVTLQPALAADLTLTLDNAHLVYGTLAQVVAGGRVTLKGPLGGPPAAHPLIAGTITLQRGDVTIPERIASSAATVRVRDVGASPAVRRTNGRVDKPIKPAKKDAPAAAQPPFDAVLDLTIDTPGRFFVRGRGVEAELAGSLAIKGTLSAPEPVGGFRLRRGALDVVGKHINFDEGRVTMAGNFDPAINFRASSRSSSMAITVAVTGSAADPQLVLSSNPTLPQDEILAQFLFGHSVADLSPLQLAQLAGAAAQLAGGTGGGDLLASVRKATGLDSLGTTTDSAGNMALQGGSYIADNLYLGVTTGAKGDTNASINLDITPELKARVGGGTDSSSAGVVFEREY